MENYLVYFIKTEPNKTDTETMFKLILDDFVGFDDKDIAKEVSERFKEKGINNVILDVKELVGQRKLHNAVKLINEDGIKVYDNQDNIKLELSKFKWDKGLCVDHINGTISITSDNYLELASKICNLKSEDLIPRVETLYDIYSNLPILDEVKLLAIESVYKLREEVDKGNSTSTTKAKRLLNDREKQYIREVLYHKGYKNISFNSYFKFLEQKNFKQHECTSITINLYQ